MSISQNQAGFGQIDIPNGPGAAAILAAGIGCAVLGILAFAGDASKAIGTALNIYTHPTGTLSGVTTVTIIVWLVVWFALAKIWNTKNVDVGKVSILSFALLAVGFLPLSRLSSICCRASKRQAR